jgi:hypothetical protein
VGENTKMGTTKCSLSKGKRIIISGRLNGVVCQNNGGSISFLMCWGDVLILKLDEE